MRKHLFSLKVVALGLGFLPITPGYSSQMSGQGTILHEGALVAASSSPMSASGVKLRGAAGQMVTTSSQNQGYVVSGGLWPNPLADLLFRGAFDN